LKQSSVALREREIIDPGVNESDVIVGKDVLELVTGAMYVDPLTIFREYIQNAADAVDQARLTGQLPKQGARVDVALDLASRSIIIRDTGTGISRARFWRTITSIGASGKRGGKQRGFRGVGRLSGLGYCAELSFRTRAAGEDVISEITWSARRFRELLRDATYEVGLATLIRDVVKIAVFDAGAADPSHFFEVRMNGVMRIRNDILLNPDEVASYLSQHGPVPFAPSFKFGGAIAKFLNGHDVPDPLMIFINDRKEPLYRSVENVIRTYGRDSDEISDVEFFKIPGLNGDSVDAVGWVAHHSYQGAIPRAASYGGIRGRIGNIQVGGHQLIESLFLEQRFNSWCIGEFHVLSGRILPNGRRDDFEANAHLQNMMGHLTALATRLSKVCRDMSIQRNRLKRAGLLRKVIEEKLIVLKDPSAPVLLKEHYRSLVVKEIAELTRIAADKKFAEQDQMAVRRIVNKLERELAAIKAPRANHKAVSFLPKARRDTFLATIRMVISACDTPELAAIITRRVFDRARRKYSR